MKSYIAWPTREHVILRGKPISAGGEGEIWPSGRELAKVYHVPGSTPGKKLAALRQIGQRERLLKLLTLPRVLLVDPHARQIAGYLMERVSGVPLASVLSPHGRKSSVPNWHYGHLVSSARNLSILFEQVHARQILFGDVSIANLLVRSDTTIVGVDTDSYQISADGETFPCPVGTDETTPPELQATRDFSQVIRCPEHDYFGLASLVTRLLIEGNHPFSGKVVNLKAAPPIGTRIQRNLFPFRQRPHFWHRLRKHAYATPTPTAALLMNALSPSLRSLIMQAFSDGHHDPKHRPTPLQWRKALEEFQQLLTKCKANSNHRYFRQLTRCPWCELATLTGKERYPSNP
jgi:DNA-binding helix-hairpin-helix protein with protein kinase domain